jgi:hypothetical protein
LVGFDTLPVKVKGAWEMVHVPEAAVTKPTLVWVVGVGRVPLTVGVTA